MSEFPKHIEFIIRNAKVGMKLVDKAELKASITELEKNVENGLKYDEMDELAKKVVFKNCYDITTRRKILYCLVPESDFPYRIVSLAVSHCMAVPVNPSWQFSVLSWLCSLLEYSIIDPYHELVHICYTSIFNLTSRINLVLLACKILGYMTRMEDVNAFRTSILLHLKEKPGFFDKVSQLLRIYQLFRPDLVFGKLSYKNFTSTAPRNLKKGLIAMRARLEGSEEASMVGGSDIWPEFNRAERANPYTRPTAFPRPDNTYYASTMEEKAQDKIFVTQYRRFSDFIKGMEYMEQWMWPNNPATHLSCPVIIPLFRPNDMTVMISITNWLQVALRIELIEGFGNPSKERREKLLRAIYRLVKVTGTHIPVVNDFLTEYIGVWDQTSNFSLILSLLEHVTYTSHTFLSQTYLKLIAELLGSASMVKWCKVVEAVGGTAGTWAVKAFRDANEEDTIEFSPWLCSKRKLEFDGAIVGLWFLVNRMESFFSDALITFDHNPMIVHQIFNFYDKVNTYSEELNLPVFFRPSVLFTFAITTQSDVAAVHRLGKMLASTPAVVKKVKEMQVEGPDMDMQEECLSTNASFNLSVRIFMSGVYSGTAFGKVYRKTFDQFYSFEFLKEMLSVPSVRKYSSVTHALPYLPYHASMLVERGSMEMDEDEANELRDEVIKALEKDGFDGIGSCVRTFSKKPRDSQDSEN